MTKSLKTLKVQKGAKRLKRSKSAADAEALKKDPQKFIASKYHKDLTILRDGRPPLKKSPPHVPAKSTRLTSDRTSYITTCPRGTDIAWDTCSVCNLHVLLCECKEGPYAGRAIEYIFYRQLAEMNGEEWTHHHPNYKRSFRPERTAGKTTGYKMPAPKIPAPDKASQSSTTDAPKKSLKGLKTKRTKSLKGRTR